MRIVLYEPEIPPNTGNIVRLCVNLGAPLDLIEPLGYSLDDARLRRAGLDYAERAAITTWPDFDHWRAQVQPSRILALSTRGKARYDQCDFAASDALLFGPETRGLPQSLLDGLPPEHTLRIPMRPGNRSLNLSNAVAVVAYEAWRQAGFG